MRSSVTSQFVWVEGQRFAAAMLVPRLTAVGHARLRCNARIAPITVEELMAHGVTRGLMVEWLTFYQCECRREPMNPSVVGRVELLSRIVRRLHWPEEAR